LNEKKLEGINFLSIDELHSMQNERFFPSSSQENPVITMGYPSFLDESQTLKRSLFPIIRKTIREHNLKIYFVMVSWWGRGDQARWTGGELLACLKKFQDNGFCEVFLSYQEGDAEPSSLCRFCDQNQIPVFYADRSRLYSARDRRTIIPKKALGKAENVMKAVKWIESISRKSGYDPEKTLLLFVDDDYTQYHWINYLLLFTPWVLSFRGEIGDPEIDSQMKKVGRISFIKSGSPRIILPYEIQEKIVDGRIKAMDYLDVTMAIVELALVHHRLELVGKTNQIEEIIKILTAIKQNHQIFTPKNREQFLSQGRIDILDRIWREYIYRGGRVTQRLEGIFRYLSHHFHYRWLRQFTFLLHGDQGAPMDTWLEYSPFGGYALEISLLMQAVRDKAFNKRHVINLIGLPHSHQRSKELAIWKMLDSILFSLDVLRVLYRDTSLESLKSKYGAEWNYTMINRFGNAVRHQPCYEEFKIYPRLKDLVLE